MSTERRVAKNTAWLVLQPLAMNVLSLAATGYIARQLGSVELGRFHLAYAFVTMFATFANMGIRALTVRHVAEHRDTAGEYLGRVLVLRTLLALGCAAVAIVAAPLSGGAGDTHLVIMVAAVGMIISTVSGVFLDGFQALERMRAMSMANLAGGLLLTVTSIVVVWMGGGIWHMALCYVLGPICTLWLLWRWSRRESFCPRPRWDIPAFRAMLRDAAPFFGIILVDMLCSRIDLLILVRVLGEARLGCHTAAGSLVERGMILATGASGALLPTVTALAVTAPESAVPLLRKAMVWLLVVSLPLAAITTALSPLIIALIFGPQFAPAALVLSLGIWRLPLECLLGLQSQCLCAVGRQKAILRTTAIATVVYLGCLYPLVQAFGLAGAQIAIIGRCALLLMLRMPPVTLSFPNLLPGRELGRVVIALLLMAVPLAPIPSLGLHPLSPILLLMCCAVYLTALSALQVVPFRSWAGPLSRRIRGTALSFHRPHRSVVLRGEPKLQEVIHE